MYFRYSNSPSQGYSYLERHHEDFRLACATCWNHCHIHWVMPLVLPQIHKDSAYQLLLAFRFHSLLILLTSAHLLILWDPTCTDSGWDDCHYHSGADYFRYKNEDRLHNSRCVLPYLVRKFALFVHLLSLHGLFVLVASSGRSNPSHSVRPLYCPWHSVDCRGQEIFIELRRLHRGSSHCLYWHSDAIPWAPAPTREMNWISSVIILFRLKFHTS